MAKLTKAQQAFVDYIDKHRGSIFFTRDKKDKERCFVGKKRIDSRVFFFFFDIGYLSLNSTKSGRVYEYFYMTVVNYKLEEYLEDFTQPIYIPE